MNARNVTTAVLAVLFAFAPGARAGRIVVANDDWIFFNDQAQDPYAPGFDPPCDGTRFAQNVARWFVGERSGSFLAYSNHRGLTAPELRDAMESAGHTWTVSTSVTLDLQTFLTYDAVFVGVYVPLPPYTHVLESILTDYVRAGGNVYVYSGGWTDVDWKWRAFLETFGLGFDSPNTLEGQIPVSSSHPLFTGVDHLYHMNGKYIIDLDSLDPRNQILVEYGGEGIFAVYEEPDDQGPITSNVVANPNPVAVGGWVTLTANVDDSTTGNSNIASAEYSLDDGTAWNPLDAEDDTFDSPTEDVTADLGQPAVGVYDLWVHGADSAGNLGDTAFGLLVVYDPSGGFVTGGGWIDSQVGAYQDDPLLTGKANFGFVSKYKKGAGVPTGNTEFQFHAGDLNFHSSDYDWLVVTGSNYAKFKGEGTINGAGPYKFQIWAGDDDPDTFRIRIWWEDGEIEKVVYDNGFNQAIGGGSIVIHAK